MARTNIADRLAGFELATCREARARQLSPALAHFHMTQERDARAVLTWDAGPDAPYGEPLDAYNVNPHELARVTSGPVRHVVLPDGSHPDGTVSLPDGATARVFVYHDSDSSPDDSECYSPEDLEAWWEDHWQYVGVSAVVTLADGREGESALWGIEQGVYWVGSDESQIWHAVPDQISLALAAAEGEPAPHGPDCTGCEHDCPWRGRPIGAPFCSVCDDHMEANADDDDDPDNLTGVHGDGADDDDESGPDPAGVVSRITGTFTLPSGRSHHFAINADGGFSQWGESTGQLGLTVDLLSDLADAAHDYLAGEMPDAGPDHDTEGN